MSDELCGRCSKPKGDGDDCCNCGRPLKFKSPEELQAKIDAYFKECDPHIETLTMPHKDEETGEVSEITATIVTKQKPYTVSSLAVWLGTDRRTLLNYEAREEFFPTIQAAKQKIEAWQEACLYDKDFPTKGVTFSMSNNFPGWKERSEQDVRLHKDGAKELADELMGMNGVE